MSEQAPVVRLALGVDEFCGRYGISRSLLYKQWQEGQGPTYMKIGKRRIISHAAAEAWRVREETKTNPQQQAAA